MTLERIVKFIVDLISKRYTGSITLNFIEGSISKKVERKTFEIIE